MHKIRIGIGIVILGIVILGIIICYVILIVNPYRNCFIFRRPLLSTVKNIFFLPFQPTVWIAMVVFFILVFCLLYVSMKWEYHSLRKSATYHNQLNGNEYVLGQDFLVLVGAFTQQGTDKTF